MNLIDVLLLISLATALGFFAGVVTAAAVCRSLDRKMMERSLENDLN